MDIREGRKRRVLFLDVDGVLNAYGADELLLDEKMCAQVDRIVEATDAIIVLSSTWRHDEELMERVSGRFEIHDRTPIKAGGRGREVEAWIADSRNPNSTRYAILDDWEPFLPEQQASLFRTRSSVGLTSEIANRVIEHLKGR